MVREAKKYRISVRFSFSNQARETFSSVAKFYITRSAVKMRIP